MDEARVERILLLLRERGGRITTARRAIIAQLVGAADHVTADDIAAAVAAEHPDVHRSTVYRCLDVLAELGVVDHVHLGHGPAVFHLADDVHDHLVCESCAGVIEVPSSLTATLRRKVEADYGFTLSRGHFALGGTCRECM